MSASDGPPRAEPGSILEQIRMVRLGETMADHPHVPPVSHTVVQNLALRQEMLAMAIDELRKRPLPKHPV